MVKLMRNEVRRNHLLSEANDDKKNYFSGNLSDIEMRRIQILMKKTGYLELSILELSKVVTYKFWYDYVKLNMKKKQNCVTWIQTTL